MSRLTVRLDDGYAYCKKRFEEGQCEIPCEYCSQEDKVYEKLAHYEDLEEQGLLLKLPVAEGRAIYMIKNNTECCAECNYFEEGCYECEDMCRKLDYLSYPQYADKPICDKQFLEVIEYTPNLDWIFNNRKSFGKTVFLTKEEAEAKLTEYQGVMTE